MDLPNPTPKAWQSGPSFVSSPSVRRKHRVRRVAHAADRRAIHSPARTSQQVESSNAQKMAHSPTPIARGTLCPGLILLPWAHSPIWSRQHPSVVSLIQMLGLVGVGSHATLLALGHVLVLRLATVEHGRLVGGADLVLEEASIDDLLLDFLVASSTAPSSCTPRPPSPSPPTSTCGASC